MVLGFGSVISRLYVLGDYILGGGGVNWMRFLICLCFG